VNKLQFLESEKELNVKILDITMIIQEKYPELSKYLGEMPVTIPDKKSPEINDKNLREYYDSLTSILENYAREHLAEGTK
jgi:hypothetical protein